jgi:hypothetical protein
MIYLLFNKLKEVFLIFSSSKSIRLINSFNLSFFDCIILVSSKIKSIASIDVVIDSGIKNKGLRYDNPVKIVNITSNIFLFI